MSEKDEIERLRRLREQQISARDPRAKARRHHEIVGQRERPTFSLTEELKHLGAKVTWMFYGAFLGLLAGVGAVLAVVVAFVSGWLAVWFLVNYLKHRSLLPFVIYRLILATVIIAIILRG